MKAWFLLLFPLFLSASLSVNPHSEVALLVNADTGAVLYERKAHELCYPASITKIATALYAAKLQKDWDEIIEVPGDAIGSISPSAKKKANYKKPGYWIEVGGTHIGLKKGEKMSFADLMAALMVASANDAANVIAYHCGHGNIDRFTEDMNRYLKKLGCKNTHFCNPHGLFMPTHQTTAADMAIITRAYMKEARLRELAACSTYTIEPTNKQERRVLPNSNKLIRKGSQYYPKAIGLKTGYTSDAQHTLVAAAKEKDRVLIAVLMRCEDKSDTFVDARTLFDKAFEEKPVTRTLLTKGKKAVKKKLEGASALLEAVAPHDVRLTYFPAEEPQLYEHLAWHKDLKPEIAAGQEVATVTWVNAEGYALAEARLVADSDVERGFFHKSYSLLIFGAVLLLLAPIFWWRRRRSRTLPS